jgi:ABC-type amino acid transport substrate-binding protein
MRHRPPCRCLLPLLLCLLAASAVAARTPAPAASRASGARTLTVGVKVAPPFVIAEGDDQYSGLAISLWKQVAEDNRWQFTYRQYDLDGLLKAVREHKVDVGLGAITATAARQKVMDFAHPMTSSGLGVAVRASQRSGWLSVAHALISPAFLKVIGILILLLLTVGVLVWLFERKNNQEQFGGNRGEGIFSGFWWAMVTMTTVGYGDVAPRSLGGRIIGLIWMLAALIVVSFFTASITSALTVGQLSQRIRSASDLGGMHIASVPGSTSAEWLTHQRFQFTTAKNLEAALGDLAAGRVDAVVYDKPLLAWMIHQHYRGKLDVLPVVLERQDYAFALPRHSPLRQDINSSLLRQINAPDWSSRVHQFLASPGEGANSP